MTSQVRKEKISHFVPDYVLLVLDIYSALAPRLRQLTRSRASPVDSCLLLLGFFPWLETGRPVKPFPLGDEAI